MQPTISIVTPSLDRAGFIERAIESVLAQDYPSVEHIVVDGESSDTTPEILSRYTHLKVVREPDRGIYDALNKGIRIAQGEIIGHLNTDDSYAPGAFAAIATLFSRDKAVDSVCGTAESRDSLGNVKKFADLNSLMLTYRNVLLGSPVINARFFRKRVYEKTGFYQLTYPLTSDRDFLLRCTMSGCRTEFIDRLVYTYSAHPGSRTFNADQSSAEILSGEYIDMANQWLARPDLPKDLETVLHRLRGEAHARLAFQALRDHRVGGALHHVMFRRNLPSFSPLLDIARAALGRATDAP